MNRVGIVKMFDTWDYFYLGEIIEISYLQFLQNLIQFRFYDYYKSNDQLLCITVFKNIPFLNFTSILQHSIFQIFFEQENHFKIDTNEKSISFKGISLLREKSSKLRRSNGKELNRYRYGGAIFITIPYRLSNYIRIFHVTPAVFQLMHVYPDAMQ